MTTETSASDLTDSEQAPPKYITEAEMARHIANLQSVMDRKIAAEQELANEAFTRLADAEARLEAAEARGLDEEDPRYAALLKERNAAQKEARDAKSLVKRFEGSYKRAIVENEALKLAKGDEARADDYAKVLMAGRTEQEVRQLAQNLRTTGGSSASTPPPPRTRDEIDAGRGSGRAGAIRVTKAWLAEAMRTPGEYTKHADAIEAALRNGPIPDR